MSPARFIDAGRRRGQLQDAACNELWSYDWTYMLGVLQARYRDDDGVDRNVEQPAWSRFSTLVHTM